MNTKLIMTSSAIFLGAVGIGLSFFPDEVAKYTIEQTPVIILQLMGAMYFGFAMLNWMAKGNAIGGIYSRPVASGNFAHFLIGGLALIKHAVNSSDTYIWIAAVVYLVFAILFGYIMFTNPNNNK